MDNQTYYENPKAGMGLSITAMVFGILSICMAWIPVVGVLGIVFGGLGLGLGKDGMSRCAARYQIFGRVGRITGAVGLGCSIMMLLVYASIGLLIGLYARHLA